MANRNLITNGDFEADLVDSSNPAWEGNYLIGFTPSGWDITGADGVDLLNALHPKFGAVQTPYGQ